MEILDYAKKVKEMREAQKLYLRLALSDVSTSSGKYHARVQQKELEQEVDELTAQIVNQQPEPVIPSDSGYYPFLPDANVPLTDKANTHESGTGKGFEGSENRTDDPQAPYKQKKD